MQRYSPISPLLTRDIHENVHLRKRILIGLITAVTVTISVSWLSWTSVQITARQTDRVLESYAFSQALAITLQHVVDIQTGARGYALTGYEQVLQPRDAASVALQEDLRTLQTFIASQPDDAVKIAQFKEQIQQVVNFSDELVTQRKNSQSSLSYASIKPIQDRLDAARETARELQVKEAALLAEHQARRNRLRSISKWLRLLNLLTVLCLFGLTWALSHNALELTSQSRQKIHALNQELEKRLQERTAALTSLQSEKKEHLHSQEQLRASEDRARLAIAGAGLGTWHRDLITGRLQWSDACLALFGLPPGTIVNWERLEALVHPEDWLSLNQKLNDAILHRTAYENEYRVIWPDGTEHWVASKGRAYYDPSGKALRMEGIAFDITARKHAEDALRNNEVLLHLLLDGIGDYAIYMLDPLGRVASWNTGAARIKGYSAEEVIGKSIAMFYPPSDIAMGKVDIALHEALTKGRYESEGQRIRKDGSIFLAHVVLFPMFDSEGTLRGFAKVLHDITERKRAEVALNESLRVSESARKELADFKYAIDQHAIVATTDVSGRITYVNDKFCAISQYSRQELLNQNHRIINSGFHPKEFFRELYQTVARGVTWHAEICNRAKDGSYYWVDTTVVPLLNPDGRPRQYIAIRTDITERKENERKLALQTTELMRQREQLDKANQALESQTQMLESVLNSIGEGLVAADADGNFILWNPMAKTILNAGPISSSREQWPEIYSIYQTDEVTPYPAEQLPLVQALRGQPTRAELFVRHPDSKEGTWIEVNAQPMRNEQGELCGAVAAINDITARKASEREIRLLNSDLEARVRQRTAELEVANRELEAFTYSVSHDLRAPLRHIAGFSKILMDEFEASLAPEARHYLSRILDGTHRMGLLVDELLNLARVGRYNLRLHITDLNGIIEELMPMLIADCKDRSVEWRIAKLPQCECDPILIKQVMQNLLLNAIKFTRTREQAIIEIGVTQRENKTAIFVRDNGVGFDMKYADKLFGVFQRLHRAEDFEGTGVGLATVQRIIHKHGGRIWAEAGLDKGATFYFTLGDPETQPSPHHEAPIGVNA